MGHEEAWKILESLIAEFRKKGVEVPSETMNELRSAKTLIQVLKTDSSYSETIPSIEAYLGSLESSLMSLAQEKFGNATAKQWIERLNVARTKVEEGFPSAASTFLPAVPRSQHWVRLLLSETIPKENVEKLVAEVGLSCKTQKNGYLLVYGSKERVKEFIKKMRPPKKFRNRRGTH